MTPIPLPQYKRVNHLLHAVLTFFTFGLWLPVWILVTISVWSHNRATDRQVAYLTMVSGIPVYDEFDGLGRVDGRSFPLRPVKQRQSRVVARGCFASGHTCGHLSARVSPMALTSDQWLKRLLSKYQYRPLRAAAMECPL